MAFGPQTLPQPGSVCNGRLAMVGCTSTWFAHEWLCLFVQPPEVATECAGLPAQPHAMPCFAW
eukprot:9119975-Pyramimonas_sp.AAC.1